MEDIKEDLFGNKYNPYTKKFYTKADLFRAGVSESDSDFIAGLRLNVQDMHDRAAHEREESERVEAHRRAYQLELSEKEDRLARIRKIKNKSVALSSEASGLSLKEKSLKEQKQNLEDNIAGYKSYFDSYVKTDTSVLDNLKAITLIVESCSNKAGFELKANEETFNKDNNFYQNNYKERAAIYSDDQEYKNLISIASLHQWEINKAELNVKNLKVNIGILTVVSDAYLSLIDKLKEDTNNSESITEEVNNFITIAKTNRVNEENKNALIEKEKAEKEYKIHQEERIKKESEEKSNKAKKKVKLIGLVVGALLIYNIVSPIKYAINNTILFATSKFIVSPGITELLSGRNDYRKNFSDLSADNLLKKKSAVYSVNFKDIVENLNGIIPESEVKSMLASCENGSLDCSEGIPLGTLVNLAEKNDSLGKLTSKINGLVGQSIGIGLNPHYVFKKDGKNRYYMEKSIWWG